MSRRVESLSMRAAPDGQPPCGRYARCGRNPEGMVSQKMRGLSSGYVEQHYVDIRTAAGV